MVILYIVLGVIALCVIYVISTRNSLVSLRNKVKNEYSQIDVQLKRRFDLIPNLVETVKGYTKHEKETLENVVEARNTYLTAGSLEDQVKADDMLTSAVNKLFALSESYPDLKANANFIDLQNQLNETEDKIAYSRQFYNDSVLKLNNKIEMFPSNLVANMFHFEKEKFFEAAASEKENIKVEF